MQKFGLNSYIEKLLRKFSDLERASTCNLFCQKFGDFKLSATKLQLYALHIVSESRQCRQTFRKTFWTR